MENIFTIDARHHGPGSIIFSWHPQNHYLASSGSSRVVQIFDRKGYLVDQIVPPSPSVVSALTWTSDGTTLAIVQAHSSTIVLWTSLTKAQQKLDVSMKDIRWIHWCSARSQNLLSIGGCNNNNVSTVVQLLDTDTLNSIELPVSRLKIQLGEWYPSEEGSEEGSKARVEHLFLLSSEDKQLYCYHYHQQQPPPPPQPSSKSCSKKPASSSSGTNILESIAKFKLKPVHFRIQPPGMAKIKDIIKICIQMENQSFCLYELSFDSLTTTSIVDTSHSMVLNVSPVVSYQWLDTRSILVGFHSGNLVILNSKETSSTSLSSNKVRLHERWYSSGQDLHSLDYAVSNQFLALGQLGRIQFFHWKDLLQDLAGRGHSRDRDSSFVVSSREEERTSIIGSSSSSSRNIGMDTTSSSIPMEMEIEQLDKEGGVFEHVVWSNDGSILSVSSANGCLYNFVLPEAYVFDRTRNGGHPNGRLGQYWSKPQGPVGFTVLTLVLVLTVVMSISLVFELSVVQVCHVLLSTSSPLVI